MSFELAGRLAQIRTGPPGHKAGVLTSTLHRVHVLQAPTDCREVTGIKVLPPAFSDVTQTLHNSVELCRQPETDGINLNRKSVEVRKSFKNKY